MILTRSLKISARPDSGFTFSWLKQKLRAIKLFALPPFYHLFRVWNLRDLDISRIDTNLRLMLRQICHFPESSARAFFAAPPDAGTLGFLPLTPFFISRICLNSSNEAIAQRSIRYATAKLTLEKAIVLYIVVDLKRTLGANGPAANL